MCAITRERLTMEFDKIKKNDFTRYQKAYVREI